MLQKIARFIETHERWFSYPMLLVLVAISVSVSVIQPRFVELMELKTLDLRFEVRGPIEVDKRVVIVAIDDDSLTKIGRWPWPRDKISAMIERVLGEYGASSIGFDIVFSESQVNPLTESLRLLSDADRNHEVVSQWLGQNKESGDLDQKFEELLTKYHDRIALGYFFYPEGGSVPTMAANNLKDDSKHLGGSAMTAEVLGEGGTVFARIGAVEGNLYRFTDAVDASGFFNFFPDMDGMVRRVPLIASLGGYYYPNLDLQTLRIALGWPDLSVQISDLGVEAIILGGRKILTGHDGRLLLNHYGPGKSFIHISAADVLSGDVDPALLKDAVVLFGVTAAGVYDYRPSPFDTVFPGVEAHAATIANMLNNEELQRPFVVEFSEILAILLLSALSGWLVMRWGVAMQIATVLVFPLLILTASQWLFNSYNFWFKETYII
ncbi:MAG: CHASE2 domain-containing protein, partial [Mariprofundaceae bacterium]